MEMFENTSSILKKSHSYKFGLKSSLIDIYEWLFSNHGYALNWPRNSESTFFAHFSSSFFYKHYFGVLEKSAFI